jgi:hypothetical protein
MRDTKIYVWCANLPEKSILTIKIRRNISNREMCHEDGRRRGVVYIVSADFCEFVS